MDRLGLQWPSLLAAACFLLILRKKFTDAETARRWARKTPRRRVIETLAGAAGVSLVLIVPALLRGEGIEWLSVVGFALIGPLVTVLAQFYWSRFRMLE
jgi:hypothetical protein